MTRGPCPSLVSANKKTVFLSDSGLKDSQNSKKEYNLHFHTNNCFKKEFLSH